MCVQTWRPAGRRILDKMRRFFVGGAPQIDDVSYVATPKNFQVSTYCDYESSTYPSHYCSIFHNHCIICCMLSPVTFEMYII